MAGNSYLYNAAGIITGTPATQISTGAPDAGKIVALNSAGVIDGTMLTGGFSGPVAADVAVGDVAYITSAGVIAAGISSAITTIAQGFVVVAGTVTPPVNATIAFDGVVTGAAITGLTVGAEMYLGATLGAITAMPPSTPGTVVQPLGFALTSSSVRFDRQRASVN